MAFHKVYKNRTYFSNYQVKYRRRRNGVTDYQARRKLIQQDKTKFNTPKYRFVVRISNSDIVCQVVYSKLKGDVVVASAYGKELKGFGMPVGTNNYAGCYATGLLLARRVLSQFKLADKYKGNTDKLGEDYHVEHEALEDGPSPFIALLDIGLRRATTGAKIFAAMKGACDGGIFIPHSETRFIGYNAADKKLDSETLNSYIYGKNVGGYMKELKENDSDRFEKQFSRYVKAGITPENIESKWKAVHKSIRENPARKTTRKEKPKVQKRFHRLPMNLKQRRERIRQKH